jgi:5-hydroxyisourate hydrolase-like protein (transthyretin family)
MTDEKAGSSILKVIVLDKETGTPIQGIPVWCEQPNSKWQSQAELTEENGEVLFDELHEGEFAHFGANYGGYFGYKQGQRVSVAMVPAPKYVVRVAYLEKGTTEHVVGTVAPKPQ